MADNDGIDRTPLRQKYSRALKQIADTLAPGMNPRRTKNRSDAPEDASMSNPLDRQTTDRHNSY